MTIQTTSITATPKQHRTRFITAVAGVLLALTAAAGVGAWQLGRAGGTRGGAPPVAARPAPTAAERDAGRVADIAPTIYLVASQAQATTVQSAIDEANAVRAALREAPLAARVEWLDSAEAEVGFLQAMSIDDSIRGGLSLAPTRVIDLRRTGAAAVTAAGETAHGGMAELYAEREAEARVSAARLERMGGMGELYREQQLAAAGQDRIRDACGDGLQPALCY